MHTLGRADEQMVGPNGDGPLLNLIDANFPHQPNAMLDLLCLWLRTKRQQLVPDEWSAFVMQCRQHPIRERLHADPLTQRAYAKPRGYPGDAAMLDLIYSAEDRELEPTGLAQSALAVFRYTRQSPASRAVCARRQRIAALVDAVAGRCQRPSVLSIAAGHLREASLSQACGEGRLGRWVALDQDHDSIRKIAEDYRHLPVTPRHGTVRSVLRGGGRDL